MTQWLTHHMDFAPGEAQSAPGEWLLTNSSGGYAMSTANGVNTRRYHGLLVAAMHPPVGRVIALNQMFEQLVTAGNTLEMTTCAFAGHDGDTFAPTGHDMLSRFERGLHVAWAYTAGPITIHRELFLHWKQQAVTLRYTIKGLDGKATLRLSPMLTLRDFHSLSRQKDGASFKTVENGDVVTVSRDDAAVTLQCSESKFAAAKPADQWWYDVHYEIDAERGQDDLEDYFLPGAFEIELDGDG